MRLIEVSDKQLLALKAVVHGCNTNKRLSGASYMANIHSESPEMISYYEAIKTVDEMLSRPTIEAKPLEGCVDDADLEHMTRFAMQQAINRK